MQEYTITTDAGETTVLLSDEDAKARGLKPNEPKKASSKQASPQNKQAQASDKRAEAVSKSFGGGKSEG